MFGIVKNKKVLIIAAIALVFLLVYFYFHFSSKPAPNFVLAKRGDLIQEVSVTGRVKPTEKAELGFEKSGRVASIATKVGDKVFIGQILIQLQNADLAAQLAQAEANVKTQQAKLDELKQGTRVEEIRIQETEVAKAQQTVADAQKNLIDKLQDAYTKSDDAVRNKIDQFFNNPRGASPQLSFSIDDFQLKIDIEQQRLLAETLLKVWKSDLDKLAVASDLNSELQTANKNLNQIKLFLDNAALAVNSAEISPTLIQSTIDIWKADVSAARTNVNAAIANLSAASEKLKTSQADLNLAEQGLILKKAGATAEEIAAQEAQLAEAEANVKNYQAQLAKTILRSPINGEIAKQEVEIGEIVAANDSLVTVISKNKFEIETYIPEADIAKIKNGESATFTLDAYGEEIIFEARVAEIESAETVTEGVATYKTTFQLIKEDERIKSGMTANIDILVDQRNNVIVIPRRAITSEDGREMVGVLNSDGNIKDVLVKTGLRGSDGNVEILEGIKEGDKIII